MSQFLNFLRGRREPTSRDEAKRRLQFVLVHDRASISPGLLDTLKDEIIAVISRYVEIDRDNVEVTFTQNRSESKLVADVPLLDGRKRKTQPRAGQAG